MVIVGLWLDLSLWCPDLYPHKMMNYFRCLKHRLVLAYLSWLCYIWMLFWIAAVLVWLG